ncbi:hypothetical protein TH63_04325 [Rufibacter radiotolerans]|uniref:Uncharacterized protein n=1 Tax=Rufibacter radiotolerans TaxID=1379910 RepID=A0A0H4W3L5_9BACT|nr:hypothetical protein [Rufibacter radiotolerans]AKQ45031.1 hypothetical protein TH63_04325 [Rufibacter radiotolerans]
MNSTFDYRKETNYLTILWVAITSVLASGFIGATTNLINGFVSPTYFRNVMGWDFEGIWAASIAQGIFEGLLYGIVFTLVFVATIGFVTKGQSTFSFGFRHLLRVVGFVYLCWVIGGLIAMGLATLSPDFYKRTFINVPEDFRKMIGYAWVGGSIWGAMFGGLFGIGLGAFGVWSNWRSIEK